MDLNAFGRFWPSVLVWPRLRLILGFSVVLGVVPDLLVNGGQPLMTMRTTALGIAGLLAFGVFERWPRNLPHWFARWVLQVLGVALVMPPVTTALWLASTAPGAPVFWRDNDRLVGWGFMVALALLLAPWTALAALVRQKDALARTQALQFDLQRSELQRQAADARLHLLAAQVAPHFLFNTLANVQALVDAQSPRASTVLRSLVAYLRAAVPRLHESATTLGQEVDLVQAYLELMHMRMPDRLAFALHVDNTARRCTCPPMTLLTLVENAIRHGIDPNEDGGRIDVDVQLHGGRCFLRVTDTGAGIRPGSGGLGTGLATLRERLDMRFAGHAQLRVSDNIPRGVCAEVEFPA